MNEKPRTGFTIVEDRIFSLGLNAYELAVFLALAKHGGPNARGIFPSWARLAELAGGLGRATVWRALRTLADCNVIVWDRGNVGKANTYTFLGSGAWKEKPRGDNSPKKRRCKSAPVSVGDGGSLSGRRAPVSVGDPNHTQVNQMQLTKGGALRNFGDNFRSGTGLGDLIAKARKKN